MYVALQHNPSTTDRIWLEAGFKRIKAGFPSARLYYTELKNPLCPTIYL